MTVCFFGHRDTPESVRPILRQTLMELIEKQEAERFYVGNQGSFDAMVLQTLQELKTNYPHIAYSVVLAYLPTRPTEFSYATIYPERMELAPARYAIDRRNRWMIKHSDTVVCYVSLSFGGAAKYRDLAVRKKRNVLNLYKI